LEILTPKHETKHTTKLRNPPKKEKKKQIHPK